MCDEVGSFTQSSVSSRSPTTINTSSSPPHALFHSIHHFLPEPTHPLSDFNHWSSVSLSPTSKDAFHLPFPTSPPGPLTRHPRATPRRRRSLSPKDPSSLSRQRNRLRRAHRQSKRVPLFWQYYWWESTRYRQSAKPAEAVSGLNM